MISALLMCNVWTASTQAYHPANPPNPLGWLDFGVALAFLLNLAFEQTADSQQQDFQSWKHGSGLKEGKGTRMLAGKSPHQIEIAEGNLRRGFLTSGLWAWSRHPVSALPYPTFPQTTHPLFTELLLRADQLLYFTPFHPALYSSACCDESAIFCFLD